MALNWRVAQVATKLIKRHTSKIAIEIDNTVLEKLEKLEVKPRKHPGVTQKHHPELPSKISRALLRVLNMALSQVVEEKYRKRMLRIKEDMIQMLEETRKGDDKDASDVAFQNSNSESELDDDTLQKELTLLQEKLRQIEAEEKALKEEQIQEKGPDTSADIILQRQRKPDSTTSEELKKMKEESESLIGQLCSAPHIHSWGDVVYHNAIIGNIEEEDYINKDGYYELRVRLYFTNPTTREMLPCPYFLSGECRFSAKLCHFSHGEFVGVHLLREYNHPQFEKLERNCMVLAKLNDKLWHRGRVVFVDAENKRCNVRLDAEYNKERDAVLEFEELLPLQHDIEDFTLDYSDFEELDEENLLGVVGLTPIEPEESDDFTEEQSLFGIQNKQPLGQWERHTRRIGSKLMKKMGYVMGEPLGVNGKGIIVPISAEIFPHGVSLDECIKLREKACEEKDLSIVQKRLEREQKKQEEKNKRAYERECERKEKIFSFLNNILVNTNSPVELDTKPSTSQSIAQKKAANEALGRQSSRALNISSLQITEQIRQLNKEIDKLNDSLKRQSKGSVVYKNLQLQLNDKKQKINKLKGHDNNLSKEKNTRKLRDRKSIF